MCSSFVLRAGTLFLTHSGDEDWLLENAPLIEGTVVQMQISKGSKQTTQQVFDRYASEQDDYAFKKTKVAVHLAEEGNDVLISRSQAKRVMARLERFQEVILSFKKITSIGPAFADEIFRVFRNSHPNVKIISVHANEQVQQMIAKAESHQPADIVP
jgi:hypothetical protein